MLTIRISLRLLLTAICRFFELLLNGAGERIDSSLCSSPLRGALRASKMLRILVEPVFIMSAIRISLRLLLTAICRFFELLLNGAGERIRTADPLITNQLLYQLSYTSL